jgi:hypothetical protein
MFHTFFSETHGDEFSSLLYVILSTASNNDRMNIGIVAKDVAGNSCGYLYVPLPWHLFGVNEKCNQKSLPTFEERTHKQNC